MQGAHAVETFEDRDEHGPACKHCGGEMEWAECIAIDCEQGWYDEYEEDPINCNPGDMARCGECDGKGGWWFCPNYKCQPATRDGVIPPICTCGTKNFIHELTCPQFDHL